MSRRAGVRHARSVKGVLAIVLPIATWCAATVVPGGIAHAVVTDTERVSVDSGTAGDRDTPSVSNDGDRVVFAAQNAASHGIWLRDMSDGTTYRITDGMHSEPVISGDGTTVAYVKAGTHPSIWVVDVSDPSSPGAPERVDLVDGSTTVGANSDSGGPSISDDGTQVAFDSAATNLVPTADLPATGSPWKVYVRDLTSDSTEIVSVDDAGDVLVGEAMNPSISSTGQWVAFSSHQDLVDLGVGVGFLQVYVHDRDTGDVALVSANADGDPGNDDSARANPPSISDDGLLVTFESLASNLVEFDSNGRMDVFVRDLDAESTMRVSERAAFNEFGPYVPVTPHRLLDTRVSGTAMGTASTLSLTIAGANGVELDALGVALNVTVVTPTISSYLTVYPKGATRPTASSINTTPGRAIANGVTAQLGDDGAITIYNHRGPVHVIVDLLGFFSNDSLGGGDGFVPTQPTRLVDTRLAGGKLAPRVIRTVTAGGAAGISPTATAVAVTVVAVAPTTTGHLKVFAGNAAAPGTSNLNYVSGENTSNSMIVELGADGTFDVWASAGSVHLVVDIYGYFDPASTHGGYTGITPHRLFDSRSTFGPLVAETVDLDVVGHAGVPASEATAVVLNLTVVRPTTNGSVSVYPSGPTTPSTSSVNYKAGTVRAAQVVVAVGDLGRVSITTRYGSVHVVVDIVGWFSGVQLSEGGSNPVITGDGDFVAFQSLSARLTDDDDNELTDAFLTTLSTLDTERVSVPVSGGAEASGTRVDPETGLTVDCVNGADPAVGTSDGVVVYVSNGDLADDRTPGGEVGAVYLSTRAT
ncbi:MAG: hypothetical protein RJB61_1689 [Actinomycetota bacterium]